MKTILSEELQEDKNISQVFNDLSLKVSLGYVKQVMSDDLVNVFYPMMPLVQCKDFLHDVIGSLITGRDIDIYNFKFNPSKYTLNFSTLALAVSIPIKNYKPDFINKINAWEDEFGFKKTEMFVISTGDSMTFCLTPDEDLFKTPFGVSFYALLLRASFHERFKGIRDIGSHNNGNISDIYYMEKVTQNSAFNPLFKSYKANLGIDLYQDLKTLGIRSFHGAYGVSSTLHYIALTEVGGSSSAYGNLEKLRQRVQQLEKVK